MAETRWVTVVSPDAAHHLWSTIQDNLVIIEYKDLTSDNSVTMDYELLNARTQLTQDVLVAMVVGVVSSGYKTSNFCNAFSDGPDIYVFMNKTKVAMFSSDLVANTMKSHDIVAHINMLRSRLLG